MSFKSKYYKYKNKYLNLVKIIQHGGVLESDIIDIINKSELPEIISFNLDNIGKHVREIVLNSVKIDSNQLSKLVIVEDIGSGSFGQTKKLQSIDNIYKDSTIVIPKDTIILGKYIKVDKENVQKSFNIIVAEIMAHSLVTISQCNLTQLYGYFENIKLSETDLDIYYLILSEFVDGTNMLNELANNNYSINNQQHIDILMKWINDIDTSLKCLHDKGIMHRDVKIDNIIIRKDNNRAVLIDYGLSCKYLSSCPQKYFSNYTSPLKKKTMQNNTKTIEIEMANDFYSLGILILDALSKMIELRNDYPNKKLFSEKLTTPQGEKYDFMQHQNIEINNFNNKLKYKYPNIKPILDIVFNYIKKGIVNIVDDEEEEEEYEPVIPYGY